MDSYSQERRSSFIGVGSNLGSKASKSQSMTSLISSSHRQARKESMPASIGGGGRFISPEAGGGSPFDAMLKGEGIGSRRGSQISMHSDRSMSMKWYVCIVWLSKRWWVYKMICTDTFRGEVGGGGWEWRKGSSFLTFLVYPWCPCMPKFSLTPPFKRLPYSQAIQWVEVTSVMAPKTVDNLSPKHRQLTENWLRVCDRDNSLSHSSIFLNSYLLPLNILNRSGGEKWFK